MGIERIAQKAMLIAKSTGKTAAHNAGAPKDAATMDVFKFINKHGEACTFRVYKDEFQRAVKKELFNHQTSIKKERNYSYKTYTYADGTTVPYKEIVTALFDKPVIPQKPNMFARNRELIATVKNVDKLDVTKSKYMLLESKESGDILEKSIVARYSNSKKPQCIQSRLTRDKKRKRNHTAKK